MHGGLGDPQHRCAHDGARRDQAGIAEAGDHVGVRALVVRTRCSSSDLSEKPWYTTALVVLALDTGRPVQWVDGADLGVRVGCQAGGLRNRGSHRGRGVGVDEQQPHQQQFSGGRRNTAPRARRYSVPLSDGLRVGTAREGRMMAGQRSDPRPARSRARLLDAATALLRSGGPNAVTVDAVTRGANVARATLYRHFPSGNDLLAAAFNSLIPPAPMPQEGGTLRERLVALVQAQAELIATPRCC